ncbi:hypothetical protein [Ascidiimonas aurantiaca]|uniref:hypothetical protein n=1 Tax=Ascidiimonas aurantiaca TaxID=1685432 RepID=UPI0030EF25C2
MDHREKLNNITATLLKEGIDFKELESAIRAYMAMLLELSGLDLYDEPNRENIYLNNGVALGTSWAALCVEDLVRTKQLIRGIANAVKDIKSRKKDPIHILYAGSGPFATLVLPILSRYSEKELQVTLIEIHPVSAINAVKVIKQLGFENHIKNVIQEDATTYQFNENTDFDIIVCETMQHALVREQQVPIMLNLIPQLKNDIQIIPQSVQVDLGLLNTSTEVAKDKSHETIATLMKFDRHFIMNALQNQNDSAFLMEKTIALPKNRLKHYDKIVLLTRLEVYGDIVIEHDQSGLTIPKLIFNTSQIRPEETHIHIYYRLQPEPMFGYEIKESVAI